MEPIVSHSRPKETFLTFEQTLEQAKAYNHCHLLTGNGFSIACRPSIFDDRKLLEQADFSRLSSSAREIFTALNTSDFEAVIGALRDATKIANLYASDPVTQRKMQEDADGLRDVLAQTIARGHPEAPSAVTEEEYSSCRRFLGHFDTVYTLNYDLLLYWVVMHTPEGAKPTFDDGFRKSESGYKAAYVVWEADQSHTQNIWYLHGALHVFDTGTEVRKYTWVNTGVCLIEQIRDALIRENYPLFVAEGTSHEKLVRIRHSDYLSTAYRSFSSIEGALLIYGHSLAANDEHYLKAIERGKLQHVFVGLHGAPSMPTNQQIIRRAKLLAAGREEHGRQLSVSFFDSAGARVWSA
jgi:hypothetical protein